ncbi:WAT1-related protein At3g30340-like isoform X3 [Phalaenopsis equestris]|uniref:WAT1-related protein At3g30340-like isoform X3 n=1 Tax=Phalaenopsis equestris TaxID=78828 RepID=UPI0009E32B01|nr:WAT1-related protein At3g30340-like isoform X3 [Phalaenopsis equestris]
MVIKMDDREEKTQKPILVMLATNILTGAMIVLNKKVLEDGLDVLVLMTYRLLVAALFMAPIACFAERQETMDFKSCSGLAKGAGTVVTIGGGLILTLYRGMVLIAPSKVAVLSHQTPPLAAMHESKRWTMGTVALLLGVSSWALWFPLQSRIGRRYRALYTGTAIVFLFSFLQTALISLLIQKSFSQWIVKSKFQILSILYGGIVGSGMCILGSSWCAHKKGPVFAIAFFPLTQVVVAAIDVSLLHEQLHLGSLLGSIVIISGLYILLWGKSKETLDSDSAIKSSETRSNPEAGSVGP